MYYYYAQYVNIVYLKHFFRFSSKSKSANTDVYSTLPASYTLLAFRRVGTLLLRRGKPAIVALQRTALSWIHAVKWAHASLEILAAASPVPAAMTRLAMDFGIKGGEEGCR